ISDSSPWRPTKSPIPALRLANRLWSCRIPFARRSQRIPQETRRQCHVIDMERVTALGPLVGLSLQKAAVRNALFHFTPGVTPMRDNKGFTLIELLIVVVIIGILAAIAIPKFSATREKAFFAAMKSDLKNLASQQEIYYSDHYTYSSSTGDLGFVSSEGVNVGWGDVSNTGWAAYATHTALDTADGCAIYYGGVGAPSGGPAVKI